MGSWLDFGFIVGFVLGVGAVVLILIIVGEVNFFDWGWCILFFIVLLLGIIGFYLCYVLEEILVFQQYVDKLEQGDCEGLQDGLKVLFKEIVIKYWCSLLICIGLVIVINVIYYMLLIYMLSYLLYNLYYFEDYGVLIIIVIMIGMLFVQLVMGLLSDCFGCCLFVLFGSVVLFVLVILVFILINSNVIGLIFVGLLMLVVIFNCFMGVMVFILLVMFLMYICYSVLVVVFNILVLVVGLMLMLVVWLVESLQNLMMFVYYLMVVVVVGLIIGVIMKEMVNCLLKGVILVVLDIQEVKEIFVEYYDNIEQKIDDIDYEIVDLQVKCICLVQ